METHLTEEDIALNVDALVSDQHDRQPEKIRSLAGLILYNPVKLKQILHTITVEKIFHGESTKPAKKTSRGQCR
jgi:hypothetical protein